MDTQKEVDPNKTYFFGVERHIEDVKQGPKIVPDLLESIMKPTNPVKEQLRRKAMKMSQFRPKATKIRSYTFWMSRNITVLPEANTASEPSKFQANNGSPHPKKLEKKLVLTRQGPHSSQGLSELGFELVGPDIHPHNRQHAL